MRKLDFTSAQLWAKIDANDERRETAYKGVLIGALCVTISSWAAMAAVFPLLYQFINLSNHQISNVLEFCEETATFAVEDSRMLYDLYSRHQVELQEKLQRINETRELFKRQTGQDCSCEAPPGPPGLPGRAGLPGPPGQDGPQGKPAVLPCQPPPDYDKWCPEPCPPGEQGHAGPRGALGEKGEKGPPGKDGANGENGLKGPKGPPGKQGKPGFDGTDGLPGKDAVPEPFIPGPPGPVGDAGLPGPIGPRGMPGIEGPQGEPGRKGPGGRHGIPGQQGPQGIEGQVGEPGKEGEAGVCPTYCASDGGVFFVEPPSWFFNEKR